MKKIVILGLVLLLAAFAVSAQALAESPLKSRVVVAKEAPKAAPVVKEDPEADLEAALEYVKVLYNKATLDNPAPKTSSDYEVLDVVRIKDVVFDVAWASDSEFVQVVPGADHKVVIDIDEACPAETAYTLTATVTHPTTGKSGTVVIPHTLPEGKVLSDPTYEEIVDVLYALEADEATKQTYRLYGQVVSIPSAYNEKYGNITVNIVVAGLTEKPIQCYRLAGEGVDKIAEGDWITVEGIVKNYKGNTIEFDAGSKLIGFGEIPDQSALLEKAFALEADEAMKFPCVIVGEIVEIPTPFNEKYGNVTVNIAPVGTPEKVVQCYRLAGPMAATLEVGQKIAVVGTIKNYKGKTIEFDAGCIAVPAEHYNQTKVLLKAYELEADKGYDTQFTITGTVSSIPSAYNEKYGNITVNLLVDGLEAYPIQCYRLAGEGAAEIKEGDVITVTGKIKNYKGNTIEFDAGCQLVK